jgi:Tol biopolymer transport system component
MNTNGGLVGSSIASRVGAVTFALSLCVVPIIVVMSLPSPGFAHTAPVNYRQLTSGSWNDVSPAWSPDGMLIAYSSDRGGGWAIYVVQLYGGGEKRLTPTGSVADHPTWSPDSSRIAYWSRDGNSSGVKVVTVSSGLTATVSRSGDVAVEMAPVWSPDGARLLFYVKASPTQLWAVDSRSFVGRVVASADAADFNPCWAGNDRVIYSSQEGGHSIIRWANLTSGEMGVLSKGTDNYWGGSISPDGNAVAYYSNTTALVKGQQSLAGNNIWINSLNLTEYDVWTGGLSKYHASYMSSILLHNIRVRPGDIVPTEPIRWSSDGRLMAFSLTNSVSGLSVYAWSFDNITVIKMGPDVGRGTQPSWSPNQASLAFCCNATGFWHVWLADYWAYTPAGTYG